MQTELRRLASLLDDEDEAVAVNAMAELLLNEDRLGTLPAELQESSDPLVRRRAHQLQVALTMRRRRRDFARMLQDPDVDFDIGLVELHLLWFDNDSRPELLETLADFLRKAAQRPAMTLADIAYLMRRSELAAECETTLRPENYCIGTILSNRVGSAALLCGLARMTAFQPETLRVVRYMGDFALCDGAGLLIPARDWLIAPAPSAAGEMEHWEPRRLLALGANILLGSAVNSDSFRYVLTIAQAISGNNDDYMLDYMPYPYRPTDDDPELSGPGGGDGEEDGAGE